MMNLNSWDLIRWLLQKEKYKCPRCNMPILGVNTIKSCDNCGQPFATVTDD